MIQSQIQPLGLISINSYPNECPFCHKAIESILKYAHLADDLQVFMICPNVDCKNSFIGYYSVYPAFYEFKYVSKGTILNINFDQIIDEISPSFSLIYNQAFHSEQEGLFEICGVGYRKALEFLIKDYIIIKEPLNRDKIENKQLGRCIQEHIVDLNIKTVVKRAVWLGNDETHYIRKWEGKNLTDLKKLIDLTIHWMQMEALTKSFEDEMPE